MTKSYTTIGVDVAAADTSTAKPSPPEPITGDDLRKAAKDIARKIDSGAGAIALAIFFGLICHGCLTL